MGLVLWVVVGDLEEGGGRDPNRASKSSASILVRCVVVVVLVMVAVAARVVFFNVELYLGFLNRK